MSKKSILDDVSVRNSIKEFIMLMLGAPLVKIEMDDAQLSLCVDRTCDMMLLSDEPESWGEGLLLMVAQDGALAHAKLILGRIRSKYESAPKGVTTIVDSGSNLVFPADGRELLVEGDIQYREWQFKVFGRFE